MSNLDHTYALILAGGGGTRLWPKSRQATPKQFLRLTGHHTMLQYAARRLNRFIPWKRILLITNHNYVDEIYKELPQLPKENIILEPEKKDTALAMLVGARYAQMLDPQAVIVNAAADHVVTDEVEFEKIMQAAIRVATDPQYMVAVGITPTEPSTAFGYIKIGQEVKNLDRSVSVFQVENFTEKPNQPTARAFIATGKYFWNANMYVWSVAAIMQAFEKYAPQLAQLTQELIQKPQQTFNSFLPDIYSQVEAISIDYAISEKVKNLVLIPADFGWNDVGEWKVVYDLNTNDDEHNVIVSEDSSVQQTLLVDSTHNLIHTNGRLVALLGLHDMIVVDTPDILLVAPKSKSQEVKKLVEVLKEKKQTEYL